MSLQYRLVRKSESVTRGESEAYRIRNYITGETSSRVSVAVSELNGLLPGTMNIVSDRVYYFVEAHCTFTFKSGDVVQVEPGDSLFIPANTPYNARGRFTAVLVNSPAFDIENEQQVGI